MHPGDAFNAAKPHAIDVHSQARSLDVIAIASLRLIVIDELSPTIHTDVILFPFVFAIFADVGGLAFRTVQHDWPQFIPPLCNARFLSAFGPIRDHFHPKQHHLTA